MLELTLKHLTNNGFKKDLTAHFEKLSGIEKDNFKQKYFEILDANILTSPEIIENINTDLLTQIQYLQLIEQFSRGLNDNNVEYFNHINFNFFDENQKNEIYTLVLDNVLNQVPKVLKFVNFDLLKDNKQLTYFTLFKNGIFLNPDVFNFIDGNLLKNETEQYYFLLCIILLKCKHILNIDKVKPEYLTEKEYFELLKEVFITDCQSNDYKRNLLELIPQIKAKFLTAQHYIQILKLLFYQVRKNLIEYIKDKNSKIYKIHNIDKIRNEFSFTEIYKGVVSKIDVKYFPQETQNILFLKFQQLSNLCATFKFDTEFKNEIKKVMSEIDLISTQKPVSKVDNFIEEKYLDPQKSYFENLKDAVVNKNFLGKDPLTFFKEIKIENLSTDTYFSFLWNSFADLRNDKKLFLSKIGIVPFVENINIEFLNAENYYSLLKDISLYCKNNKLINELIDLIPIIKNKDIYDEKYFEYLKYHLETIINCLSHISDDLINFYTSKTAEAFYQIKVDYFPKNKQTSLSFHFQHLADCYINGKNALKRIKEDKLNFIRDIRIFLGRMDIRIIHNILC